MTALILIGLVAVCARLWFRVDDLTVRISVLEGREYPTWQPEPAYVPETPTEAPRTPDIQVRQPAQVAMRHSVVTPEIAAPATVPVAPEPERMSPDPIAHSPLPATEEQPVARGGGLEDLFGRRLPIWAGGITLAVAGFLIVKYSIDAGLLSPVVRVVLGLLFGSALIVGAEAALRAEERVRDPRVRQALSGAGIATIYAGILAAANLYDLIGPMTAFVGMALTTALAGGLALRFGAPSAVLGLVGGLAAPALVGSGTPNVPLLSAYLSLTVGGLCALSRTQRWMWLGVAALIGGFGWGGLLILGGALDLAATLSVGVYALLLGLALPLLAFAGRGGTMVRLAGSLTACAQLAALVATGGFGTIEWSLFALISAAIVWLSRREAELAELPAAGLAVALLLTAAWPTPPFAMLATVVAGTALIFGGPAAYRMWRSDARLSDAIGLSVVAAALVGLPAIKLDLTDGTVSLLALLGATVTGAVAMLGWNVPARTTNARFAILAGVAAALTAFAAMVFAPAWLLAPAIAGLATVLLILALRADDPRIDSIAVAFAAVAILAALTVVDEDLRRATGVSGLGLDMKSAVRWFVPALMAAAFAWRSRLPVVSVAAQPLAAGLSYVAIAQIVPTPVLPLMPLTAMAALGFVAALRPALMVAAALTACWVATPLVTWLTAGGGAITGIPMLVGALPALDDTGLRLALPALVAALLAWRSPLKEVRRAALPAAMVLGGIALHIAFKHGFAIEDAHSFAQRGMAERTVWEMLLAGIAIALWQRMPVAAQAIAVASIAHFVWFTLLLHDPLWEPQSVGSWPVANLLLPAFGTIFALTWRVRRLPLPPLAMRATEWLRMVLIVSFVAMTLRHAFHGAMLSVGPVGEGENIARSVLLIMLAIGFLQYGIRAASRDWRIASLVLMLVAVAKVFLVDAAGLDGLFRIASFAALGFSLIGIGWLYARYLPENPALTPDPELSASSTGGN